MLIIYFKKLLYSFFVLYFILGNSTIAADTEYDELINNIYQERRLDVIEGIWIKVYANQGPTGCVTIIKCILTHALLWKK